MGDIPIFVAHDSADVWAHPELFLLAADGSPSFVAGVPPDYFSATGQLLGQSALPLGRRSRATGYAWWIERFRASSQLVRLRAARPLPRLRGLLGDPGQARPPRSTAAG